MSTDNKKFTKHFDEEKILKREREFIECYRKNNGHAMKIFFKLFKGDYFNLFVSSIFFTLKSFPTWVTPLITADVINIAVQKPDNAISKLVIDAIILLVVILQNIPTHTLHIKFLSMATRNVEAGLRGAMVRKLQQLSISFHKEMRSGKIHSKVMRDVEAIEMFSIQIFTMSLAILTEMSVALVIVINKSLTVFLMFLLCVPSAVLLAWCFRKPMQRKNREFRKEIEQTSSNIMEMIELVPVTRAHSLEKVEIEKATSEITNVAERGYRLDKIQSILGSSTFVIFAIFRFICLFFTGFLAFKGMIKDVGDITLYQSYFGMLLNYVQMIINFLPTLSKGIESINSIGEIMGSTCVENNDGKEHINNLEGQYEFRDVHFEYDDETPVLKGFNLKINRGETIALVGESGSGKSTILNLVIGFNRAKSGTVLVDGKNIDEINLNTYRKQISIVPQKTILFSGTIRENITYGNSLISDEYLQYVIDAANLRSVINKLPHGLDTQVGEHGDNLSGGQKQRISIARAIIRNPKVIIFDEATSALDSVSEKEIQDAIDNLTHNRTTFIVAHRLSTIRNADKIAVMSDGKCIEFGTYKELMAKKGAFYEMKKLQS